MAALCRVLLLVSVAALTTATGLFADESATLLPEIISRLRKSETIELAFEQEKRLRALKRPIISSGTVTITPHQTVRWTQAQPFAQVVTVNQDGIEVLGVDGMRVVQNDSISKRVSSVFLALLSGDLSQLTDTFNVTVSGELTAWSITLEPHGSRLKDVLSNIHIQGGLFISSITVREAGGDITAISLRNARKPTQ